MAKNENPQSSFWNGKNLAGQSSVGNKNLIPEGKKNNPDSHYEVSNDTKAITVKDLE